MKAKHKQIYIIFVIPRNWLGVTAVSQPPLLPPPLCLSLSWVKHSTVGREWREAVRSGGVGTKYASHGNFNWFYEYTYWFFIDIKARGYNVPDIWSYRISECRIRGLLLYLQPKLSSIFLKGEKTIWTKCFLSLLSHVSIHTILSVLGR